MSDREGYADILPESRGVVDFPVLSVVSLT